MRTTKTSILGIGRDTVGLITKVLSLGIMGTGKLLGASHTAVDKLTSLTKEGYMSQRIEKAKSKSNHIDNA
jgi:hypothetical protein